MIREQGRVVAVEDDYALVSSVRKSACGGCQARASCSVLSGGLGNKQTLIPARNPIGAVVGELVTVEVPEGLFLKASFLIYVVPILALIGVGSLVRSVLVGFGAGPEAEGIGAVAGLLALGISFAALRRYNARIEGRDDYMPVISAVVSGAASCSIDQTHG